MKGLAGLIDPADLAEDGVEKQLHITAKYGLRTPHVNQVKMVLSDATC